MLELFIYDDLHFHEKLEPTNEKNQSKMLLWIDLKNSHLAKKKLASPAYPQLSAMAKAGTVFVYVSAHG